MRPPRDIPRFDLRDALRRAGSLHVWVSGASMAPLLLPGDRVEVVSSWPEDLRPGEIVLLDGPTPTLHRFLWRERGGLVAKGDAARSTDPSWPIESVLGRAVRRIREGRELRLDGGWELMRGRLRAWAREAIHGVQIVLPRSRSRSRSRSD